MSVYSDPFSKAYWRDAAGELKNLKKLTFAALMMAICIMLSYIPSVPLIGSAKLTWGFLGRSVCAMVCGPVLGAVFGVAEDLLSFFLTGGGGYPFFPGYTLTTMLGMLFYALFFYRAKITVGRIFLAKLVTNIQNVLLGALWSAMLYSKGYLYYMTTSAWKNALYLIPQILLLALVLAAVLPVMHRLQWAPRQLEGKKISWK
jgi:ECF transporter S component (folate family)